MRLKVLLIGITVALCLTAVPATADVDTGKSVVSRVGSYYGGTGGEFTLSTATLDTSAYSSLTKDVVIVDYTQSGTVDMTTSFQTFCVETDEHVYLPDHNIEQTIINTSGPTGSQAVFGGSNTPPGTADPLSYETAYLYTKFATGTLGGYHYSLTGVDPVSGLTRAQSAVALQQAIWKLEDEIPNDSLSGQALIWFDEANSSGWTNIGGVRVLNLWDNSSPEPRQDQLYYVPVPGAILLGILGLGAAGLKLRKFA